MKNVLKTLLLLFVSTYSFAQESNIGKLVDDYAAKNQFNGTVLVQKNNSIIYGQNKGGDYLAYNYLTDYLASQGYFVVSIQHELADDLLMPLTGIP